jgi:MazG family protein
MTAETNGADPRLASIGRLLSIVDRLRAPDGCPWDKKQTVESMAPYLVEEAHEALEAIESQADGEIAEEVGDVLMVACMIGRIGEDADRFDIGHAAEAISDKLVRRHPHVFGEVQADTADEVLKNWESIKKDERKEKEIDASALAGVPAALPALQRADRVCGKAVSAGFRWTNVAGAIAKVFEEQEELRVALKEAGLGESEKAEEPPAAEALAHVEHELGDVLLSTAFLASYLKLDPEKLCRQAVRRFEGRFRTMETALEAAGNPIAEQPLTELTKAWEAAKEELG